MKTNTFLSRLSACRFALAALVFLAAAEVRAVTYLKADAPEGGDGTSWASAFRNAEEAVKDALAKDKVVYAAGGLYVVTNEMEVADGFQFYGGFAGLSADEVPEGRDIEKNRTLLTGDRDLDDNWGHVEPRFGAYDFTYTDLPEEKIIVDGALSLPPPYTGEFDAYRPIFRKTNTVRAFSVQEGAATTFDGLWFSGFGSTEGTCIYIATKAGATVISDCRFIGNRPNVGQIGDNSGKATIARCHFRFSETTSRASGVSSRGKTDIVDCLFESLPRRGCNTAGVIFFWSGGGTSVRRSVFARCLNVADGAWGESNYGGPGNIVSAEAGSGYFVDCVISNTFSASAYSQGTPLMALRGNSIRGTSFINNRYEVKPVDGRAYTLIGAPRGSNYRMGVIDCTFRGNVIAAPAVTATTGSYALGIVGNAGAGHQLSVVNCTFDSNKAECAEVPGVVPVLSRALLDHAPQLSQLTSLGVMNCTFDGPVTEGVYDIAQVGPAHQCDLTVVNSIFMGEGAAVVQPFYMTAPSLFKVVDCTIKNQIDPAWGFTPEGLRYDAIPFVREDEATVSHVPVLVPMAWTPGLRETADVATNSVDAINPTFRYRPRGTDGWIALVPIAGGIHGLAPNPIEDANGTVRPFGGVTRGATQRISATAEKGVTLTLRRDPLLGGTLSSPSTQAVLAGEPIAPVTAIPIEGSSFIGWFEEDGTLFSEAPRLEIPALSADRVLTARFGTPERSITFDLGSAGLFDENGLSSIVLSANQGESFPAVPPFTMSESWFVDGWTPAFPAFVPASNTTFRAEYITRDVRVLHVVPEGEMPAGSDGSGSSWANATDDLIAAYREAGRYRGEVWMKGGLYTMTTSVAGLSNVSVLGGFAGTETSSSAADPAAHPTIISGDVKGDTYWLPNGSNPQAAFRTNLWVDGVFSEPNPSGADDFWQPGGNNSDDFGLFFGDKNSSLENVLFQGLTFTSFRTGVLALALDSTVKFRDCRFLANATASAYYQTGVFYLQDGRVEVEDCDFIGNHHVATFSASAEKKESVFRNCRFRENFSSGMGACFRLEGKGRILVEDCDFIRNCGKSEAWRNAAVLSFSSSAASTMRRCLFRENRIRHDAHGTIVKESEGLLTLESCRFLDNDATLSGNRGYHSASITITGGRLTARDCYFAGNKISIGGNLAGDRHGAVLSGNGGESQFLGCTMIGNVAENNSSAASGVGVLAGSSQMAFVNCLVDDSRLIGNSQECVLSSGDKNMTFAMINTIVRNGAEDYVPFRIYSPNMTLALADSAISKVDVASLATGNNGYLYDVSDDPGALSVTRTGPKGLPARGVAASSPYVHAGRSVWLAPDGYLYFHDEGADPKRPWRRAVQKTSYAASIPGLTPESPLLPDAFGAPRRAGRIAYGPLNAPTGGTILLLR